MNGPLKSQPQVGEWTRRPALVARVASARGARSTLTATAYVPSPTGGGTLTSFSSAVRKLASPCCGVAAPVTTGWDAVPACDSRFEPLPLYQAAGSTTTRVAASA